MTVERFKELVEEVVDDLKNRFGVKGYEYTRGMDRLHNFKVAGRVKNETPERALLGMEVKHRVSIMDLIDDLDRGGLPTREMLNEKFGDEVAYCVLLKALFIERLEGGDKDAEDSS